MEQIPAGEMERTMKVQEVKFRAMAKKIQVAGSRDFSNQRNRQSTRQ